MKTLLLLSLAVSVLSCGNAESSDTSLPYQTTFTTAGDTIVAATTGEVPDSLLRRLVVEWRSSGDSATDPYSDVSNIAVAPDGKVWVFDGATPRLLLFGADGKLLQRISRRGSGPGEYQRVNDIAVLRDAALVMWDDENARMNIYNPDGTFRRSANVGFNDCCGLPVLVDSENRIWLMGHPRFIAGREKDLNPADFGKPEVVGYYRFDSTGAPLDTLITPTQPGADAILSSLQVSRDAIGGRSRRVPYGTYPLQVASPLGHIVTAMTRPYVVHTESDGKHVRLTRDFTPIAIDDDERAQERAYIEFIMRQVRNDWTWNGPEIPREKPPINDLMVGLDGRIWVQLSVPSESYEPDSVPAEPNPFTTSRQKPPLVKFRPKEKRWDVFEPDGRYLGRIVVPREISLYVARGNQVWGVIRDEDDVPTVVRMRIAPAM
jgi:hypothetical protein